MISAASFSPKLYWFFYQEHYHVSQVQNQNRNVRCAVTLETLVWMNSFTWVQAAYPAKPMWLLKMAFKSLFINIPSLHLYLPTTIMHISASQNSRGYLPDRLRSNIRIAKCASQYKEKQHLRSRGYSHVFVMFKIKILKLGITTYY